MDSQGTRDLEAKLHLLGYGIKRVRADPPYRAVVLLVTCMHPSGVRMPFYQVVSRSGGPDGLTSYRVEVYAPHGPVVLCGTLREALVHVVRGVEQL